MKILLALAAAAAVFLVTFTGLLADAHCIVRLYRSPSGQYMKIWMNNKKFMYLSLAESRTDPAIQFIVDGSRVAVFDQQATQRVKSTRYWESPWKDHPLSRQYIFLARYFRGISSSVMLNGPEVQQHRFFTTNGFKLDWLPEQRYKISLEDVPRFSLSLLSSLAGLYYEIKSPLIDLETRIDEHCRVRVFRHGVEVVDQASPDSDSDQASPSPSPVQESESSIQEPPRPVRGWNPMDPNSWTLFDRQSQQAGSSSSSSSGFRFARPLEPAEPDDPAEAESP